MSAHIQVPIDKTGAVVSVHNPDGAGGSNSQVQGTTADIKAKTIQIGPVISTAWKNPA